MSRAASPPEVYKAVYAMGHHIVGRYLTRSGLTPLEAVGAPWREVWNIGHGDAG